MAKHEVKFVVPERPLGRADVEFAVKKDGIGVGRLKVSNGNIVWVPKGNTYGYRMSWDTFDSLMQGQGRREKGG